MRFLIVNTDYRGFLDDLYCRNRGLAARPYEEQMRVRYDSLFGTADFYSSNLTALGHEAWDVIANAERIQKQWASENGTAHKDARWRLRLRRGLVPWPHLDRDSPWLYTILAAQVKAYRPDVLFCMAVETVGSEFLRGVKGSYRLAVGQHAAPLPARDVSGYDLMLSSLPSQVDHFRAQGMKSELFRLGFEPRVLDGQQPGSKRFDVVFVGGLGGHHARGTQALELLCRRFSVAVWGYGVEELPDTSAIHNAYRGAVWGADMYQVLREARIAFNRHIEVAGDYANNLRLYEATGVGTMLLTDWKQNLPDLFEPGVEVVAYRSPEECVGLAERYLAQDPEREAIARRGQQRTLRDHTWRRRMQELVEIVRKYL